MTTTPQTASMNFEFVSRLADSVIHAHTLEELVRPLLELLQAVTGLESTYLTRVNFEAGVQSIIFARNTRYLQIPEGLSVQWEGTLCKRALEEGRLYTDDVANCWGDSEAARALGIATYASTPVHTDDGELYGTLCAASDERKPLAEGAEKVLEMFSRLIGQQVDRERLLQALSSANEALAKSALVDSTTALPNRRALMDEMTQRLASREKNRRALIVAFIDLDRFKEINDQYGHDVGDKFLMHIGRRLQGALRADDYVARLGGDEFVVLSSPLADEAVQTVSAVQHRLQAATTGRFSVDDVLFQYVGPSIGTIVADAYANDPEQVLAEADHEMYVAKRERNKVSAES